MKIITIVGARPQFVKAAVVSRAFQKMDDQIEEKIIHTGQHYDPNMSDVFFNKMKIPQPSYNLGIGGGSHGQNTGRMIEKIEEVLLAEKPDGLLVYGDTDSTLAGAIAASKLHIPVYHVEAGLRSYNKKMPEELNRIMTDHVSEKLFTPTITGTENLKKENVVGSKVIQVGDVMYDAAMYYKESSIKPLQYSYEGEFILSTLHRAENTDFPERISEIINSLNQISKKTKVVLPVHPRTRKILEKSGLDISNLILLDPVGYFEMIWLLENCKMVITDSGGLQKEAYFFGKMCLTTRDETEWVELVNANVNILVGADSQKIISNYEKFLSTDIDTSDKLYGHGDAGDQIVANILKSF